MSKILIIEDELSILDLIKINLSLMGPEIHTAKDRLVGYKLKKTIIQDTPLDIFDKFFALKLLELHKQLHGDYIHKLWSVIAYILWYEIYILNIKKF